MLAVLSPAKKLAQTKELLSGRFLSTLINENPSLFTQPPLMKEASILANILKKKSAQDLASLMSISEKLAILNHSRWQVWKPTQKQVDLSKNQTFFPAGHLFQGDVYQGMDLQTLSIAEVKKLNRLVFILSGLYGALRPLDLIMPYRLEMGTELKTAKGKNLITFWEDQVAKLIHKNLKEVSRSKVLLNLASEEYFSVIKIHIPTDTPIIQPMFYDRVKGKYQMVSFYAKKARGLMARYLAKTWSSSKTKSISSSIAYLKEFTLERYYFSEEATKNYTQQKNKSANTHYLVFYRDH